MPLSEETRVSLRQRYKLARREVSDRKEREAAISHTLSTILGTFKLSSPIAAYIALPDETSLEPLYKRRMDQLWALPKTAVDRAMTFHEWRQSDPLEPVEFGILAPSSNATLVPAAQISAVLMPLVAFDRDGVRLGMGGGYYDRYLINLAPNTPRIGIAFDCQLSATSLPKEDWDVTLSAVVTESGMVEFNK
ncbi:MAG: 5-formyltetrahydrofolate cyclo-ligase [Pseudomonadales bacterium]|nr:5-formyltetrahydrofolate cyclo-ligase [Pseudomonadales bacterium]